MAEQEVGVLHYQDRRRTPGAGAAFVMAVVFTTVVVAIVTETFVFVVPNMEAANAVSGPRK